jgi:hypothetical protein
LFKDTLSVDKLVVKTNELIAIFEDLKTKQAEAIQIFNKLNQLNETTTMDIFKFKDKTKVLSNINTIQQLLDKSSDIIPDYDLNLTDLPNLNITNYSSPVMEASTSNIQKLNTQIEKR